MFNKKNNKKGISVALAVILGSSLVLTGCSTQSGKEVKTEKTKVPIPYEVKIVEDNTLEKGKDVTKVEGKDGVKVLVSEVTIENGKIVKRKQIKEEIAKKPVDKVITVGTKE
ncbi:G5 domain-containing protein [Actinomyces sp. zg-332]|uniref:G5 domain-containing protein n=1 Tax=Actinomyces sp. zg-332 TaxID=2708340 RepID=UPI001422A181|nr:G5 domain-containing protein [Actinomyces sp. zg-332]QPK93893.1 G5 domain-containing protein [Actinomyces sp. zg-332]